MRESRITGRDLERRTNPRFPLDLPLTFRTLSPPFTPGFHASHSVNISSTGVLFETEVPLNPGQHVLVAVEWPARLDRRIPLNLILEGRIVRAGDGLAALQAHRHEFRTRGANQSQESSGDPLLEGLDLQGRPEIRMISNAVPRLSL